MNSGIFQSIKSNKYSWIVVAFALLLLLPTLFNLTPLYYTSPDIEYVKAKTLRVLEGDLFIDPVTGITNFHPPYYHLFLALLSIAGISLDLSLTLVTILNVFFIIPLFEPIVNFFCPDKSIRFILVYVFFRINFKNINQVI